MHPSMRSFENDESGIKRVVEAYYKMAPRYAVEYVECDVEALDSYDIIASHAGRIIRRPGGKPMVSHCHGLYWTGDYETSSWEWKANVNVITSLRSSNKITVPSQWVAETIRRDMRVDPYVIGHGVYLEEWTPQPEGKYVLWNKNRMGDVCDPTPVAILATKFSRVPFLTTFYPKDYPVSQNVHVTGVLTHNKMKPAIEQAAVYLATTKETFGIGILEAMASGVPVLGYAHGGILDLVKHGESGYLAVPGDLEDLARGLVYCLENRNVLGENGRYAAYSFTWDAAFAKVRAVYEETLKCRGL